MQQEYDYSAFISYKREDEKWAEWLQNKLERYHIPLAIRKEIPRLPKRIKPVFRDKTDLGAGGLMASLYNELERSHYLIVICSPNSASSEWVGKEINYFRALGREERIIPFIVSGVPHSGDADTECFHPIFNDFNDEPLGIDINDIGKQRALTRVLAKILDVRPEVLDDRIKKYKRKKLFRFLSIFLLFCCFVVAAWFYTRPLYKYYADYVDRWGVPEGIIELDPMTVEHRTASYRFEYRRNPFWRRTTDTLNWRLSKVEYVNSVGNIIDHANTDGRNRYAIQELEYEHSSGAIKNIDFCNKYGRTLLRWKVSSKDYEKATIIDFLGVTDLDASGYHTSTSVTYPLEFKNISKSPIKRYFLTRDSLGFVTSISYHENNSSRLNTSKITDVNGIHKIVYTNDSLGRRTSARFYDLYGNIVNRRDGVAIKRYEYDKWGNINKLEYLDSSENYILNSRLFSKVTSECDRWGNVVKERYYGINGELTYNEDNYAQRIFELDKNGFLIAAILLDINGELCVGKEGYATLYIENDSRGNQIKNSFGGLSANSCLNAQGFGSIRVEYDRWGYPTHMAFYSWGESLTINSDGVSGWNAKYDRLGNLIQRSYFGMDWNVCSDKMGVASFLYRYNDRGDVTQVTFLDLHGDIVQCEYGYAALSNEYLENSLITSYYDVKGTPCNTNDGFHKVYNIYDDYGNLLEQRYYDKNNKLCKGSGGYAIYKATYDELSNVIQEQFFESSNNYVRNIQGVKIARYGYDKIGRNTSARFYESDNSPAANVDGVYGYDLKYDSRGNRIECLFLDENGNLSRGNFGYAKWIAEYDYKGNQLSYATYDEIDNLVAGNNGVAKWSRIFNERGLLVKSLFYNEKGVLCVNADEGFACYEAEYNDALQQIMECTYDEKGNLCIDPQCGFAKWVGKYDEQGNKIEMLTYSERDSLIVCKHGYARWLGKYDKEGDLIESLSYDEKGNLLLEPKESKKENIPEIRMYDSHRFEYELVDILFGIIFFAALIIFIMLWAKNIIKNSVLENLCCIDGIIVLLGFDYLFLRRVLLYYSMIPYDVYNYSWILFIVSSIGMLFPTIFLLILLVSTISPIINTPKSRRIIKLKESLFQLFLSLVGIIWCVFVIYYMIDEGWIIYSNPL